MKNFKKSRKICKKEIRKKLNGFTLVELIVVIAIIGILAAILIPTMMGRVKDAKIATANDAAAKVANQAAIIATDMEMKGTSLKYSQAYGAGDVITLSDKDPDQAYFRSEMEKSMPTLKNSVWAIEFNDEGSIVAAICIEKNSRYIGLYPNQAESTMSEIISVNGTNKIETLSSFNKIAVSTALKKAKGESLSGVS